MSMVYKIKSQLAPIYSQIRINYRLQFIQVRGTIDRFDLINLPTVYQRL
jgi:hypothetical protein